MAISDEELGRLVQLHHAPPDGIEQRANGYFFAHCGCGYISARRRTPQLAAEALIHHMREVGKELLRNGVSVPSQAQYEALMSDPSEVRPSSSVSLRGTPV